MTTRARISGSEIVLLSRGWTGPQVLIVHVERPNAISSIVHSVCVPSPHRACGSCGTNYGRGIRVSGWEVLVEPSATIVIVRGGQSIEVSYLNKSTVCEEAANPV